jgi:adenylosuccinate synthase
MTVTVVVGGQYGSEGKGKLVSYLAAQGPDGPAAVVRCGGPNAGHTADGTSGRALLRQLPSGAVVPGSLLFMAAGMQIDVDLLHEEVANLDIPPPRLRIDRQATLLSEEDPEAERDRGLGERIASTLSGTGAAISRRVLREPGLRLAEQESTLAPYLDDVSWRVNELIAEQHPVIVEGTQGFGLSLFHGTFPFVTGRDTTAAGFLAEAGISPMAVSDVVLVLRTYPIRVAGNSGPLDEISWEEVVRRSGYPVALAEYTTVTGRLRRVGEFDWNLAEKAVTVNRPTALALHGVDYLDHSDLGATQWHRLGRRPRSFIDQLEQRLGVRVRYVFTGPDRHHIIDRGPGDARAAVAAPSDASSQRAASPDVANDAIDRAVTLVARQDAAARPSTKNSCAK